MEIIIDDDGVMHKVFTKDEVVDILEDLKEEIRKLQVERKDQLDAGLNIGVISCSNLVQQKIDALKSGEEINEKSSGDNNLSSTNTNWM